VAPGTASPAAGRGLQRAAGRPSLASGGSSPAACPGKAERRASYQANGQWYAVAVICVSVRVV
jgi:hypothetical protein